MPSIACSAFVAAVVAVLASDEANAASRQETRRASSHRSHSTSGPRVAAPAVVARVVPAYVASPFYAARQPLSFARSTMPPVYYVGAISPDAPPFSFSPSQDAQAGWGWQRVSYQQLDTEVRARRAAKAQEKAQGFRQYCPDTRSYYPDVVRCESEWLNVVSRSTTLQAPNPK